MRALVIFLPLVLLTGCTAPTAEPPAPLAFSASPILGIAHNGTEVLFLNETGLHAIGGQLVSPVQGTGLIQDPFGLPWGIIHEPTHHWCDGHRGESCTPHYDLLIHLSSGSLSSIHSPTPDRLVFAGDLWIHAGQDCKGTLRAGHVDEMTGQIATRTVDWPCDSPGAGNEEGLFVVSDNGTWHHDLKTSMRLGEGASFQGAAVVLAEPMLLVAADRVWSFNGTWEPWATLHSAVAAPHGTVFQGRLYVSGFHGERWIVQTVAL